MGDVDRTKHDVDVLERVIGALDEPEDAHRSRTTPLLDVEVPWFGGTAHSTVELTVGLPSELHRPGDRTRER